jgi:hypothetical protein
MMRDCDSQVTPNTKNTKIAEGLFGGNRQKLQPEVILRLCAQTWNSKMVHIPSLGTTQVTETMKPAVGNHNLQLLPRFTPMW